MSDSDDTDILLLIPPDFFLAETSFFEKSSADLMSFSSLDLPTTIKPITSFRSYSNCSSHNNQLIKIDQQIANLEQESINNNQNYKCNLTSNEVFNWETNNSFDTDYCIMNRTSPIKQLNYSTPKQQRINGDIHNKSLRLDFGVTPQHDNEKFLLKEIDYYLGDSNSNTSATHNNMARNLSAATQQTNNVHSLAVETLKRHNSMLQSNYVGKQPQPNFPSNRYSINDPKSEEPPLISLSQIWGPEGETETSTMHEERLRRKHCEREIQTLQTKLLEYQQKISVAMKIDKSKDEAICRLQETNSR